MRRSVRVFSPCWLGGFVSGNAEQNNRLAIGEFCDKREVSPHGLNGLAQRGEQQIAPLFKARNTVLRNAKLLGDPDLR